jgi:hypothetical protein
MGFFPAERHIDVPTKDILSWTFDEPKYDQDEPVSFGPTLDQVFHYQTYTSHRFTSMLKIHRGPFPHGKPVLSSGRLQQDYTLLV